MPKKGDVHVVPGDNGWRVEVDGQGRASGTHDTQAAAWDQARGIAQRSHTGSYLTVAYPNRTREGRSARSRMPSGILRLITKLTSSVGATMKRAHQRL
jgi:Uncharacterized protein conserved in bacteria (DUF2188)